MSVTNSAVKKEGTTAQVSLEVMEQQAQQGYTLPGTSHHQQQQTTTAPQVEWVRNTDGTPLIDHRGRPITVDRMLATKPLRGELSTRPGPGNRKLTYLSGEGVTRTLNDIFGFDGWNLDIKTTQREECVKDDKGRFHVAYTATVRLTHRNSGAYKEDCGAGDSIDKSLGTAVANSLKASITDAMKRAARHFGDKLGNSLYQGNFSINSAPSSLKDALDQYDIQRAKTKFGFPKDRTTSTVGTKSDVELAASVGLTVDNIPASASKVNGFTAKQPPKAPVPAFNNSNNNNATKTTNPLVSQTPGARNPLVSRQQTPSVPTTAKPVVSADRSVQTAGVSQQQQQQQQQAPPFASRQKPQQSFTSQGQPQQQKTSTGQTSGTSQQQQQAPPFASRQKPQPPFAPQGQAPPPPTSTQGLQSSALFKLSAFAAGNNTAPVQQQSDAITKPADDENMPPAATNYEERPTTSNGNKAAPPPLGALLGSSTQGKKRALEAGISQSSQAARKAPANSNPYRASL